MSEKKFAPNPLLARLKRGSGVLSRWPGLVGAALFCAWIWYSYLSAVTGNSSSYLGLVGIALGASVQLSLLLFLAWLAANFPIRYMRSAEYELVCATPLTNADWVAAFVGVVLYRSRTLILTAICLTPLLTAGFPVVPWPAAWLIGVRLTADAVLRYLYFTAVIIIAWVGLYRWVVSMGVSLALWWRTPVPAALVASALPIGTWLVAASLLKRLGADLGPGVQLGWEVAWTALAALAPYGLARLTERWGQTFARASAGSVARMGW